MAYRNAEARLPRELFITKADSDALVYRARLQGLFLGWLSAVIGAVLAVLT